MGKVSEPLVLYLAFATKGSEKRAWPKPSMVKLLTRPNRVGSLVSGLSFCYRVYCAKIAVFYY